MCICRHIVVCWRPRYSGGLVDIVGKKGRSRNTVGPREQSNLLCRLGSGPVFSWRLEDSLALCCRTCLCALYVFCFVGYFGGINKFWLTVVDFMVSDTSDDRGKANARLYISSWIYVKRCFWILWFLWLCLETMFCMAYGLWMIFGTLQIPICIWCIIFFGNFFD